jgi:plastocyanin
MTTIARNIRVATALALAAFAGATSLSAASARAPDTEVKIEVKIDNFTFAPQRIVVQPGTTVTWTNADDAPHTVVSTTKLFKSSALDTTDKFSFTFATPGTYEYFCSLHPHMTGTVVVEAAAAGSAAQ